MKNRRSLLAGVLVSLVITAIMLVSPQVVLADSDQIAKGKELAFDRKKGNCLACHMIDDGSLPGTTGPPLVAMQQRFPEFEGLVSQISNPLLNNPNSMMPPFGLHNILSDEDIQNIAVYIYTL